MQRRSPRRVLWAFSPERIGQWAVLAFALASVLGPATTWAQAGPPRLSTEVPAPKPEESPWLVDVTTSQPDPGAVVVIYRYPDRTAMLIVNKTDRTYYGYELFQERRGQALKLSFAPLSSGFIARWLESGWNSVCPGCSSPRRVIFDARQLPAPVDVHAGDSQTIEMQLDPSAEKKLVQTYSVSRGKEDGRLRMELALLVVNEKPMTNLSNCDGEIVYFFLGKRGRYLVSSRPSEGFQPVGVLIDKQIEFAWGSSHFRWLSSATILHTPGIEGAVVETKQRVWVKFDKDWVNASPPPDPGTYGCGAVSAENHGVP
jgi:hypothetical protein